MHKKDDIKKNKKKKEQIRKKKHKYTQHAYTVKQQHKNVNVIVDLGYAESEQQSRLSIDKM